MEGEPSPGARSRPARLVIADDHYLVRGGFRNILAGEPDLTVVGEAENGREAVELCRKLHPDLVLMDVRMPEMDGLQATRAIKEKQPEIGVLVVTTHENPDYLLEALKAGAAGYVLKDAPKRELLDSVRRVLNGESPLDQELAARLIRRLGGEAKRGAVAPSKSEKRKESSRARLTARELEVLQLMARGQSNPEIARNLLISRGTVKVHVQRVIGKLGASDRTQAVVRAIDLGLVATTSE
jgi:DNA-binding NarL/FixJ family response regulator